MHCKLLESVFLLQGSRGIQGPQGAVGKKGENVSEHTYTVGGQGNVPDEASVFLHLLLSLFRVYQVLMEKMAHLVVLEQR